MHNQFEFGVQRMLADGRLVTNRLRLSRLRRRDWFVFVFIIKRDVVGSVVWQGGIAFIRYGRPSIVGNEGGTVGSVRRGVVMRARFWEISSEVRFRRLVFVDNLSNYNGGSKLRLINLGIR